MAVILGGRGVSVTSLREENDKMGLDVVVVNTMHQQVFPLAHVFPASPYSWLPAHQAFSLCRSVDFLLDSSLRKLYPSVGKPSTP